MRSRVRSIVIGALALVAGGASFSGIAQIVKIPTYRDAIPRAAPDTSCNDCGVVRSVREISRRRDSPGYAYSTAGEAGGQEGRVVGALVVLPFGPASGKPEFIGAAGTSEMTERFSSSSYEITVRMDDGSFRVVERRDAGHYQIGDRVRIADGRLELLTPTR